MSMTMPARRLTPRCLSYRPKAISLQSNSKAISTMTRRKKIAEEKKKMKMTKGEEQEDKANPVLAKYRAEQEAAGDLGTIEDEQRKAAMEMFKPGDLAPASLFEDEQTIRNKELLSERKETRTDRGLNLDGEKMFLNPNPRARDTWLRRKVIQTMRKSGRMTKEEMIARTEREHLVRSPNLKTSVKKLGALARQISGKTLEHALLQMQFSKKGVAEQVYDHLIHAKHEATVARGMGLGSGTVEHPTEGTVPMETTLIRLKDNKKHKIVDPTTLYIDQAWVGRGPYGKLPDYRARGRMFIMRTPWTSLTVVLKEEKTRVREYTERVAKEKAKRLKKVWQHLPDKLISGHRGQYYSW